VKTLKRLLREARSEIVGGLVVAAVTAAMAALYSYAGIRLIPAAIVLAAWLACAYLAFSRTKLRQPVKQRDKRGRLKRITSKPKHPRWQMPALIGFVCITVAVLGASLYFLTQAVAPSTEDLIRPQGSIGFKEPSETKVLIADFDGPEPEQYRVTELILSRVTRALKPYQSVKVEPLRRAITEEEGKEAARAVGEEHGASIVIWGWYGATEEVVALSVNFEILCPLMCSPELRPEVEGEIQFIPAMELQTFALQTQLSDEMALLSLLTLGLTQYSIGDWGGAIASFTEALSYGEEQLSARDVYYYRGMAYVNKGDYDKALADYDRAIKIDPLFARAYSNRANIFRRKGDIVRAMDAISQAISLQPNEDDYYRYRGIFYWEGNKDYERAIADFNTAIELAPDEAHNYRERGLAYFWIDDYDRCIADLDFAISSLQDAFESGWYDSEDFARDYNYRGTCYLSKGNPDLAIPDLTEAILLKPDYTNAYTQRGNAYLEKGDYGHAIADFNQAIILDPNFGPAYISREAAYLRRGDYERTASELTEILRLQPNNVPIYFLRGLIYKEMQQTAKAVNDFKKVVQLGDGTVWQERAVEQLNKLGVE